MNIEILPIPPEPNCETIAILKALSQAGRALGELKGEVKRIPNSQILIDTFVSFP
ncbi:Fic/DOC family N-terminal domain-containing protein [Aequorivita todarodis]|uniref:Fic/DOC family N-terminal domain-containing protein n=1 Tax=Aequorivita todarodis TaxID=2036821 RepID=UPI0023502682|nr:Fic/DOC family N-terminal domain-containing protein [Aequorivita todarodis]MDC7999750.1 Fic/DOC family N-terminal domain-containing protein [Aequorivita todarodis]